MRFHVILPAALLAAVLSACDIPQDGPEARGFALPGGDAQRGQQAFSDLKCYTCHEVEGLENELPRPTANPVVGVKLGGLAMREPTDGELLTAIINAPHEIYPGGEEERVTSDGGSRMANYNDIITAQQLIDLVAFLHERYETTR